MIIPLVPPVSPSELLRCAGKVPLVTSMDITQPVPKQLVAIPPIGERPPDCTLKNIKSVPTPMFGLKISVTGEHCEPALLPTWREFNPALLIEPFAWKLICRTAGRSVPALPHTYRWPA